MTRRDFLPYVIQNYSRASIPLETLVMDLNYMDNSQIWTLGSTFPQAEFAVGPPRHCLAPCRMVCGPHAACTGHASKHHVQAQPAQGATRTWYMPPR